MGCFLLLFFNSFVGTQTHEHLIEIDLVRIKLRSIHTDELGLASDRDTAGTTHTGTIDHDRVQRGNGRHIIFLCK